MGASWKTGARCVLRWAYLGPLPARGEGPQISTPDFFAWLLVKGHAKFSFNNVESPELSEGEWGFPPPNAKSRSHHFSEGALLLSLRFNLELPGGDNPLPFKRFIQLKSEEAPALKKEAMKLVSLTRNRLDFPLGRNCEAPGFALNAKIQASFWRWLSLWLDELEKRGVSPQEPAALDARLRKALAVLERTNPHEPVPYEALGKELSLGRVQTDRLFKEGLKSSPKKIQERRLLALCKERVAEEPESSTKELAESLGFVGASQFCAWFKKRAGVSPQRFKELEW